MAVCCGAEMAVGSCAHGRLLASLPARPLLPQPYSGALCREALRHCLRVQDRAHVPPQEDSVFSWGLRVELTVPVR